MSLPAITLIVGFILIMAIGAPIYLAVFSGCTLAAIVGGLDLQLIVQRGYASNDSFPFLAILFFCVAGELMLQGGIGTRIVNFTKALTGKIFGRLSAISFIACAFFGAISGSAYATTTTIGKLMYPEMVKEGYRPSYASAVQAVGGTLGVLIPPSMSCVIYGNVTGESVGDMLLYILPVGLITTIVYVFTGQLMMRSKRNPAYVPTEYAKEQESQNSDLGLFKVLKDAFWALMTPVIILGGIYTGVFTPTECAIVASFYAWLVGTFVYKELNLKTTYKALLDAAVGSACIMIIINAANVMSFMMARYGIAAALADFVKAVISNKIMLLFMINVVYMLVGMFCESCVTQMIIVPLLYPIAMSYGINGIHLGMITVLNPILGSLTPPFGGAVFVANAITRVPIQKIFKDCMPFLLAGFIWCFLLTYVPLLWL